LRHRARSMTTSVGGQAGQARVGGTESRETRRCCCTAGRADRHGQMPALGCSSPLQIPLSIFGDAWDRSGVLGHSASRRATLAELKPLSVERGCGEKRLTRPRGLGHEPPPRPAQVGKGWHTRTPNPNRGTPALASGRDLAYLVRLRGTSAAAPALRRDAGELRPGESATPRGRAT